MAPENCIVHECVSNMRGRWLPFALAVCVLSCRDVTAADAAGPARDASPAQTDSTVYHLHRTTNAYAAFATVTYVNRSATSVYYAPCGVGTYEGPLYGVRRTGPDSTRRLQTDIAWGCGGRVPTKELRPGDSVTVRVRLGAYDQPTQTPPVQREDLVGLMRVQFSLCARSGNSDDCALAPLPQTLEQSNAFDVRY